MIVFLSGKVSYHIEGKTYHLNPWDILLVSRGAIHKPEIDFLFPTNGLSSGYGRISANRF